MRWFKVTAAVVGVIIAFLVVSSVVGFIVEAVIAVLVVAVIVLGVKVALGRKQVSWERPDRDVGRLRHSRRLLRHTPDVEDELSRMKGDMGG